MRGKKNNKRNAQDATIRNVRAANLRLKRIEQRLECLTLDMENLNDAMLEVHPNFYRSKPRCLGGRKP